MNATEATYVGRHEGLSIHDYHHNTPGFSKSDLDLIHRSIAHYQAAKAQPQEPTPALRMGAAIHTAVLEPAEFEARYISAPKGIDRRTKEGKATWAEFEAAAGGREILSGEDMAEILRIRDSVLSHPIASQMLTGGYAEHSIFWEDLEREQLLKCRPDYLRADGVVIDLKTTGDARFDAFQRSIVNYRYHVQGAMLLDGVGSVAPADYVVFIAVEKEAPYAVAVYAMDAHSIKIGRDAYREDLKKAHAFLSDPDANLWPGYPLSVQEMFLPAWAG